jgi:hypothetical protein
MHEGGLIANGKAFPAFATALARLARDGAVETEYPWWPGAMLATPELRQAVRDQLVDAEGLPRLGVAKVLASAYGCYGETKAWCDFLEATIAKTQDDTKAMWLLARAYSESASMPEPDPLAGRKWFDQALAAAKSDGLRFRVVQDLVRGEMTCRQYKIASSLLESVAGQFASTQGAAIDALRQAIVQGDYECRLAREQYFAASRAESRAAWEGEIQRRVEEGKQNGRPEEADRYSKMLSDQPAVPPERPPVAPGQGI